MCDFYLWFRTTDKKLNPWDTFEITNGTISEKQFQDDDTIGDVRYRCLRVVAVIHQTFDTRRYPIDNHTLQICIEDGVSDQNELRYVPDLENIELAKTVEVPGWTIKGYKAYVGLHTYKSNFGNISSPPGSTSDYSRFNMDIIMERETTGKLLNTFMALFVAVFTSILTFFIKPTFVDPRFGLSVGALFAAVASHYLLADRLPENSYNTLSEWLHIVGIGFIFIAIIESVIALHFYSTGHRAIAKKLDRISVVVVPIVYCSISLAFFIWY